MPDLLLELFSEEIPARMQARAAEDLKKLVTNGLVEAGLTYASAGAFSTPRRLTLTVEGMVGASPNLREERKGPRVDAPEKAIEGFLRSTGLTREDLEVRDDKKGQVFFAVIDKPGRPAAEIVAEVVTTTIRNFPWPKSMRWGAGTLRWVRPLQSILCILSDEEGASVVPFEVDGIASGDTTEGHRFMAPGALRVTGFDDYQAKLSKAFVVLDAQAREEAIWHDATQMAFAQGLEVVEDKGLLREVAGLVEWPVVLMGEIGADFLELPAEVLQTSMKEHQKFFSVRNPRTGRIERYVTVANRATADNGATILAGNGKVLSARLADAKFFWENDLRVAKAGMGPWLEKLENVTFHAKLGTQAERIKRIEALAREIAPAVGADADQAAEAARLAKADLASEMVYEFPELQGVMGRYYAAEAGASPEVAAAAQEHYAPLGPSDDVPTAPLSIAVALADKLDTLTGFWAIDEKPTGSGDPFALRRAALGVIRIQIENATRPDLLNVLMSAAQKHPSPTGSFSEALGVEGESVSSHLAKKRPESDPSWFVAKDLLSFFADRLKVYLRSEGIRHDVIDAVYALGPLDDIVQTVARIRALQEVLSTEDGTNLVAGYKRANNILTAEEKKDGIEYSLDPDAKFATAEVETALFAALDAADAAIKPALAAEDYAAAMGAMAALRGPIDAFFEGVKVNDDNPVVRRNRLCLLNRIRAVTGAVADLSQLDG